MYIYIYTHTNIHIYVSLKEASQFCSPKKITYSMCNVYRIYKKHSTFETVFCCVVLKNGF